MSSSGLEISVVIPTRDRPQSLARCLRALPAQGIDVVVVDDGSRERAAVEAATRAHSAARLIRGARRGPAAARNLGARAAAAPTVAFIDDDCEPASGWAERLAAAIRPPANAESREPGSPGHAARTALAPGVRGEAPRGPAAREAGAGRRFGIAAGRTVSPAGASALVRGSQVIANHGLLSSLDDSGTASFAPSCNLAVSRELLGRIPFDESFPFAAGEDRDWCDRALAAGLRIAYVPEAVVIHHQDLDRRGFARQQFGYGRGAARFRAADRARRLAGPRYYADLVRAGFHEGAGAGASVLAAQLATAAGVAAERLSRSGSE